MHKFPPATELRFLIGKEVGQVCLDPHSVQFHFWNGGGLTVEFDLEHVADDGETYRYNCTAHSGPPILFHRLIGKTVAGIDVEPLRLTLFFDDGQTLSLHSKEGPYECGLIRPGPEMDEGWIIY